MMYPSEPIESLARSSNADMAAKLLSLGGNKILDIGCGQGAFTRFLAEKGAQVVGIDPDIERIAAARAAARAEGRTVSFGVGIGECLPFASESFDIVVFSNSLHHVPVGRIADALKEAARVLRAEGNLYVMEPVPQGPFFELQRLWNDETEVRRVAYDTLVRARSIGLLPVTEVFYSAERRFADFEAYRTMVRSRGTRAAERFAAAEERGRHLFARIARVVEDGLSLDMVFRVNILRKGALRALDAH